MILFLKYALPIYCIISVITFGIYAIDKYAAKRNTRRTPEKTLHLLALLGGWPGALLAQQLLRHKTIKQEFRVVFWGTVIANLAVVSAVVMGMKN